jgi:hypothetical protein
MSSSAGSDSELQAAEGALARYRKMHDAEPWDWGRDWRRQPADAARAFPAALPPAIAAAVTGRPELQEIVEGRLSNSEGVRRALEGRVPRGVVVVRVSTGGNIKVETPVRIPLIKAGKRWISVLLDLAPGVTAGVMIAGRGIPIPTGGAHLAIIPAADEAHLLAIRVDGVAVDLRPVVQFTAAAQLVLRAGLPVRWGVTDDADGAWFPDGLLTKWDSAYRPFFHGDDLLVHVPAVELAITATRGIGYRTDHARVEPTAGAEHLVKLVPQERFDPRRWGWAGVDLHVHLNYSGNVVCDLEDALRMQAGEGLDLLNLLAANLHTAFVYDREAFEATVGRDLPTRSSDTVARMGIEYRNDLLGHMHTLGLSQTPRYYQTGHVPAEGQTDWPPNSAVCEDLRAGGAVVGYCHPVWQHFGPDGSPSGVFDREPRSVEARELVADAALGLVDSMDLLSPADTSAAVALYYKLLNTGIRLAATAGTDAFLSFTHGFNSDPPGWARTFVKIGRGPVSVEAVSAAIRRGETLVTNGPWVEFAVDGHDPGAVVDVAPGSRVRASARALGPGMTDLELVGPDGAIARATPEGEAAFVSIELLVDEPGWLAARVRGESHPEVLGQPPFAHTTPVYIDVGGRRIERADDAAWCLDWLERLEALARRSGRYSRPGQIADLTSTIARAREFYGPIAARS